MKVVVIKWWRTALLGLAVNFCAHAGENTAWKVSVIGGAFRFDPAVIEQPTVPVERLSARPDAAIQSLVSTAGVSLGLRRPAGATNTAGLAVSPAAPAAVTTGSATNRVASQAAPAALTNRTVSVLCVSGCEGLFKVVTREPMDAS